MIADLNNLKRINDTYGHRLGDEAIINTANLINDNFNDIGNCYRIGGVMNSVSFPIYLISIYCLEELIISLMMSKILRLTNIIHIPLPQVTV